MALKVAIIGLAPTSHHLAPWTDPDWELWGLAWDSDKWRLDRVFEMHDIPEPGYEQDMRDMPNLYMQGKTAQYPNAKRYPFEEVAETIGLPYWCSSIAYAMALAIHEGAKEIGLWGVNMAADEEYHYQRPNLEYLIGFARGKGIKVHIPDSSPLCKFTTDHGYVDRYGKL